MNGSAGRSRRVLWTDRRALGRALVGRPGRSGLRLRWTVIWKVQVGGQLVKLATESHSGR